MRRHLQTSPVIAVLSKVISGGQIGADIAGLRAAKELGIKTGGFAPKGWKTLAGAKEEWLKSFNLIECKVPGYPARTEQNVIDSDCTIRLAVDFTTLGERATLRELRKHKKPYLDVVIDTNHYGIYSLTDLTPNDVAEWIIKNKFDVINIAGNALPQLEQLIFYFLYDTFLIVHHHKNSHGSA